MLQHTIQVVIILFLLSTICERIADFLKHYLSKSHLFNIQSEIFKIGDTITKFPQNDAKEQARAYRILKINVWTGIFLATILKADLLEILINITDEPGKTLGWKNIYKYGLWDIFPVTTGIILTGCFISFGSKFWHDLLDILYQIKNTKRVLSDPETYQVDKVTSLQKIFDTYQSDFIKVAYLEAKTKFMAIDTVQAIGIKTNELGYYFEITVSDNESGIGQYYQYYLEDGTPLKIPIKIIVLSENDKIFSHGIDLSARIFDIDQPEKWGTLGVLVKSLEENSDKKYLLTCCHNVVNPIRKISIGDLESQIKAGTHHTAITTKIGTVVKANRDFEIDAALIEIDSLNNEIINSVPKMGNTQKPIQLSNRDAGNVTAFVYGAKTGVESNSISKGTVMSIYNTIKVTYGKEEFTLINTIAISNKGKSISQSGDSGACVLDSHNNVIGLVVAGNSRVTYALAINTLLTKLNVKLI